MKMYLVVAVDVIIAVSLQGAQGVRGPPGPPGPPPFGAERSPITVHVPGPQVLAQLLNRNCAIFVYK